MKKVRPSVMLVPDEQADYSEEETSRHRVIPVKSVQSGWGIDSSNL